MATPPTDTTLVNGLDHIGLVVADIDRAAAAFTAIGFCMTPLSMHSGALVPGGTVTRFGTGNRCAMLRVGYLELISVIDPSQPAGSYPSLLAQYEGLHIIALSVANPAAYEAAMKASGVDVDGVFQLTRMVETGDAKDEARFTVVRISRTFAPEARVIGVRHETPETLWRPPMLLHANGAQNLSFVATVVASVEEAQKRFSAILGVEPRCERDVSTFDLRTGNVQLCTAEYARLKFGVEAPSSPFNAAFGVGVSDLEVVRDVLRRNEVPFLDQQKQLIVGPTFLCGAACVFGDWSSGRRGGEL
jgi:catechol 2,3-dioxygenase-like lactoylglutathione lyase family enzyme